MKIIVDRPQFLKALSHAQGIVERRTVTPILANVLLKAQNGKLTITATDLDLTIIESLDATTETEGEITLPAQLLYDIIRKIPEGSSIDLSEKPDSSQVIIKAGRSRFTLPSLPAEEFTPLKTSDMPNAFSLPASSLSFLLQTTKFAVSTEEARYYLNGIFFHTKREDGNMMLRTVATDGHRLAKADYPMPGGASGMPEVIIPRKTINELSKLLDDQGGDVKVSLSHTQITFVFGSVLLASRLIDGSFPDYESVIPNDNTSKLIINTQVFAEAVDRVATISQEKSRGVKLSIETGKLTISATSNNQGSGTEELEASYEGPTLEIGFNARYILDICQQVESENLILFLKNESTPTILQGEKEDASLYVLMPMRI